MGEVYIAFLTSTFLFQCLKNKILVNFGEGYCFQKPVIFS